MANASVTRRLLSGVLASWSRIAVIFLTQICLVPVFLSRWDQSVYGVWISYQAILVYSKFVDYGFHAYVQSELLKIGRDNRPEFHRFLSSVLPVGALLGLVPVLFFAALWLLRDLVPGVFRALIDSGEISSGVFLLYLVLNLAARIVYGSFGGILSRALYVNGYFASISARETVAAAVVAAVPALVVWRGGGLREAMGADFLTATAANLLLLAFFWRSIRKERLAPSSPDLALGFASAKRSVILTVTFLFDLVKQQGIRVFLPYFASTANVSVFSTERTASNVIFQASQSYILPIIPEMMHFINQRDQDRLDKSIALIWSIVLFLLIPVSFVIEFYSGPLFAVWTRGKLVYDPNLFTLLVVSTLVFSLYQPAMGIVQSHNLLRTQFLLAAASGTLILVGIAGLVPRMGLAGVGAAFVASEIVLYAGYTRACSQLLRRASLAWPARQSAASTLCVVLAAAGLFAVSHRDRISPYPALFLVVAYALVTVGAFRVHLRELARRLVRRRAA